MGFPILKLPVLALKVLLDHWNNIELIAISLLSKRADRLLKICGKKNDSFFNLPESEVRIIPEITKFELLFLEIKRRKPRPGWNFSLSCTVNDSLYFTLYCPMYFNFEICSESIEDIGKFVGDRRCLKIGDSIVPFVHTENSRGDTTFYTFWNSQTYGLEALLDAFKNDFCLPIYELKIKDNKNPNLLRSLIRHINTNQIVVQMVKVCDWLHSCEDDYKFVLENVSATNSFSFYSETSPNFTFDGRFKCKYLYIENGYWFTIEHLLKCNDLEHIVVFESNFKKAELRTFLEEWKDGKFPNLKRLLVNTEVKVLGVLEGFERREDKCIKKKQWIAAIKGKGDIYGTFDSMDNQCGKFFMYVHNN